MVWGCQQGIVVHCGDGHWTYITNTPTNTVINTLIMDWAWVKVGQLGVKYFLQGRSLDENLG